MKTVNYEDLSDDYKETLEHNGKLFSPFNVVLPPAPDGWRYKWRSRDSHQEESGDSLDNYGVNSKVFRKLPSVNGLCEVDGLVLCFVKDDPVPEFKLPVSVNPELEKIASLDVFMDENPLVDLQGFDLSEFEKREDEALAKVNNKIEFWEDINRMIDSLIKTHGLERNDWISIISELKSERPFAENRCWNCDRYNPMDKIDF